MAYMFLYSEFSTLTGVKMTYFYFVENVNKQTQSMLCTLFVKKSTVDRTVWSSAKFVNSSLSDFERKMARALIEWIDVTVVTKTYTMKEWVDCTKKGCWHFFKECRVMKQEKRNYPTFSTNCDVIGNYFFI